ncbi:hypothetical protein DAEQUDRAFT_481672 [Daedalea quercina L-15889]|uniref:Uncharacterized protein n=1 Tax=Daedalea quercina L-15889 TaxID=1314783 RepID=A0A165MU51_9APHY|nr:hypothetical protein DAEQUDRAFT_481672 [Daedalea quercina L-15889]
MRCPDIFSGLILPRRPTHLDTRIRGSLIPIAALAEVATGTYGKRAPLRAARTRARARPPSRRPARGAPATIVGGGSSVASSWSVEGSRHAERSGVCWIGLHGELGDGGGETCALRGAFAGASARGCGPSSRRAARSMSRGPCPGGTRPLSVPGTGESRRRRQSSGSVSGTVEKCTMLKGGRRARTTSGPSSRRREFWVFICQWRRPNPGVARNAEVDAM